MSGLFERLTGLALASPWMLALALLLPGALLLRRWRGRPAILFGPGDFLAGLPRTFRARLTGLPRVLEILGLVAAIVALARPVRSVPMPRSIEGIDILLTLDVSSSMTTRDLDQKRDRLEVAKAAAAKFVAGRPDDRVGLVCFARYPDLRCPLTLDHTALVRLLGEVTPVESDGPEDATGIGTALARSAEVLRSSPSRSRVVVLLTDGEENVATVHTPGEIAPVHAAQLMERLGVRVFSVVVGLGHRGPAGDWIPLDTTQVRQVAERTGGRFFAAKDAGTVEDVYREIDRLTKDSFAEPRFRTEEWFLPFLLAAIALLVTGCLLGRSVLGVEP